MASLKHNQLLYTVRKTMNHYEYTISEHFLSAVINNDYSGLDDSEHELLEQWLDDNSIRSGHWSVENEERDFAKCEIINLMSNCVTIRQYFRK
jgi:hypothetical protein